MKVVIFSGGSGSAAIQTGIFNNFKNVDVSVITNAYDNGKSTGLIRQVYNGKILGPSDVRKNQTRHAKLENKAEIAEFLEHRFTSDKPLKYIKDYSKKFNTPKVDKLLRIIEEYFEKDTNIVYEDFSIGNIVYGYLSNKLGGLQAAADYMKDFLDLKYKTILNSDESLFLNAITESGKELNDEADIVDHASDDKIVDIYFYDHENNRKEESTLCERAEKEILSADMIIFSSGTMWSSLFPTYKSKAKDKTFRELINESKAKKYLVMNADYDKDMYNVTADEILNIINDRYFDLDKVKVVISSTAKDGLNDCSYEKIINDFTTNYKHDPDLLIKEIFYDYYGQPNKSDIFVFDWDDTITGRNNSYISSSIKNKKSIKEINSFIISGNTHHKINHNKAYADGGINYYLNDIYQYTINDNLKIDNETKETVINILSKYNFSLSYLQNRGDVCLSIKPIVNEYRDMFVDVINSSISADYKAIKSGKTTIDIMHKSASKLYAIEDIKSNYNNSSKIFYIGDEYINGNDKIIFDNEKNLGITCIPVNNPDDTATFISTIKD